MHASYRSASNAPLSNSQFPSTIWSIHTHTCSITTSPPSPLLGVNKLSRSTYLESYTPLLLSPKYSSAIYADLSRDTLFFDTLDCSPDGDLALDLSSSPLRTAIQRIAISVELWEVLRVFRWDALSEIRCLSSLKSMALVLLREGKEFGRVGNGEGVVNMAGGGWETVEGEIRHSLWYVENLRSELEIGIVEASASDTQWETTAPNVQLWLL
jgi:hypothetical protein